jgi:hypothetical protein
LFLRIEKPGEGQKEQSLQLEVSAMSIAWDDPVSFGWDSSPSLVGRTMTLGTAIDYFAKLSPKQKICARISLSSPLLLSTDLPPAYELSGGKIDTLVALRQASGAKLAA